MRKQVSPRIGLAFCLYTRENILTILYSHACLPVTYLSQSIQCTTAAATNNQLMQAHPAAGSPPGAREAGQARPSKGLSLPR